MNPKDYRTEVKPVWCPGCGLYGEIGVLTKVFTELQIPNHLIVFISGIGCSSRTAGYLQVYANNTIHGEALPIGQGVKLARPELTVVVQGGDGDIWAIGAGHIPQAVRRNLDITLITCDNQCYALTKGQMSPTTPFWDNEDEESDSQQFNPPLDPLHDTLAYMSSIHSGFVAQGISTNPKHLTELIKQAILHRGFSYVHIQTPCVTFNEPEWIEAKKKKAHYLEEGKEVELPNGEKWIHDPSNRHLALKLTEVPLAERPYYGIIYKKR